MNIFGMPGESANFLLLAKYECLPNEDKRGKILIGIGKIKYILIKALLGWISGAPRNTTIVRIEVRPQQGTPTTNTKGKDGA